MPSNVFAFSGFGVFGTVLSFTLSHRVGVGRPEINPFVAEGKNTNVVGLCIDRVAAKQRPLLTAYLKPASCPL